MTGYIDDFKNHRVQLQEALSLYTASNIKGLVMKMNDLNHLISRLLKIKPDWEKTLATKTQSLGDRSEWIESDAALQAVVSASEDPVLEGIATKEVESKPSDIQSIKLSELRDELDLSLDKLCNRNMDIFESELELLGTPSRTVESQEAIARSAQFVVRTLSGPYDRLLHEVPPFGVVAFVYHSPTFVFVGLDHKDLRALWKEMVSFEMDERLRVLTPSCPEPELDLLRRQQNLLKRTCRILSRPHLSVSNRCMDSRVHRQLRPRNIHCH